MKKVIILGSTGSIGTQTLDVIRAHPEEFTVIGLSAHENTDLFVRQVREFQPKYALQTAACENSQESLRGLASASDADLVVNAISGTAGLMSTIAAVKAGKKLALVNKESLVMAGELIMKMAEESGAEILPIDSEPSAIWQCLSSRPHNDIEKIILTASGGPFFGWPREKLKKATAAQALKHPTWKMGEKITIDSATLMNKAFEIIETRWLFDIPPEKIDITIHRQSIVHALVQFADGNTHAVLSQPDMRIPISYALFSGGNPGVPHIARSGPASRAGHSPPFLFAPQTGAHETQSSAQLYPRHKSEIVEALPHLDFSQLNLTFEKPDYSIFEGPKLAYEVLAAGGIMPAAFCIADEIAVRKFLDGEISFLGIYDFIKCSLERVKNTPLSIEAISNLL